MKKVVDGKVYNTETAELVHEWSNGRYGNDFRYRGKDLYRTKKGNLRVLMNRLVYIIYKDGENNVHKMVSKTNTRNGMGAIFWGTGRIIYIPFPQ